MSLRVSRPRLALRKDNFIEFAPEFMYEFFEKFIKLRTNIVISGETGTGKTEFQKLLASFIDFKYKIVLIEDTAETFLKEMFPDKDILSWLTSADVTITDLIKAALRNNPRWILVTETRGKEAYEMIQAVLSGHHVVTSLHA
ncbi:ATPase, T2SS/T4P/T4SS family, partial [Pantoea agglomerans]|uniref:ATPase, T2SS/T4P/T4SS family n=1 Tax=Enterobacter agglomerans TaxID=549 RepID=UPI001ABBBBC5